MNRYVPSIVKTSSEYSLNYCHRVIIFKKMSSMGAHGVQPTTDY